MGAHEFVIPVHDLDAAGRHYVFPVRAAWLRGALEDHDATTSGKDGELDVRASKSGRHVVIHGKLTAELQAPCARCLDPVTITVAQPVTLLMVPSGEALSPDATSGGKASGKGGKAGNGEGRGKRHAPAANDDDDEGAELSSEEADTLTYDGDSVVLDDFVRSELMLETPMIPLCSEDCPGMSGPPIDPSKEGAGRPIDPRLMPLLRFSADKQQNKKQNKE